MQREFYKLILVAIMIVFAFSLGFFLGREVTLAGPRVETEQTPTKLPTHQKKAYQKNPLQPPRTAKPSHPELPDSNPSAQTQKEKVIQYKKNWLKEKDEKNTASPVNHTASPVNPSDSDQLANKDKVPTSLEGSPPRNQAPSTGDPEAKGPETAPEAQKKPQKPSNKIYALWIKSHKNRENAMKQSTDLKLRFPRWRFFFKKTGESYTVYIGPFKLKQSAQRTLRKLKNKKGFASTRIEEL